MRTDGDRADHARTTGGTLPDTLRTLDQEATPGPWYVLDLPWLPHGCETSILAGSPDPHVATWIADMDFAALDEEDCKSANPDADARLIVALRNALPEIISHLEAGWQPIEQAPEGNEDSGPFFDVLWAGETHRHLPVPRREVDCYREHGVIKRQHGYPSMTTVFLRKPTHFHLPPAPPSIPHPPAGESDRG